jgi:2-polyprenyl-3-methyl-5-hydroxy-6-metoxy-1,4-benzoquinol methylase
VDGTQRQKNEGLGLQMTQDYPRTEEVTHCLLCGSESEMHANFETNHSNVGEDRYLICERCGLVFQSPRLSEENLNAFYASQYRSLVQGSEEPIEKDLRIQNARAKHLLGFVDRRISGISSCLDIGSSTGILLKKFKEKYGCEVLGIEPGDAYRTFSQNLGIPAKERLEALEKEREGAFDLITMAHALEHLADPISTLRDLKARWLSPEGYLLVEIPNLYGHHALELAHLTAFSSATLKLLLQQAGFETLRVQTHGKPRSLLIPLYITALAKAGTDGGQKRPIQSNIKWIRLRRKLGMFWNKFTSKFFTRWAWLPWPEVEN